MRGIFKLHRLYGHTHLNPVSDTLVVGFVLEESVQLVAELLSSEGLLLIDFL